MTPGPGPAGPAGRCLVGAAGCGRAARLGSAAPGPDGLGAAGGGWRHWGARVGRGLLAIACSAAMVGCGIQIQREADPLPSGALVTITPSPSASPGVRETSVYFVSGRVLTPVPQRIADRSANGVMAALAAGPPVERQSQLRTLLVDPLSGEPVLSVTSVTPSGHVVLRRSDSFLKLPATDQVLLVAQVVASLDEIGLSHVEFTDAAGARVPVPLPDGRVAEGDVRADDFAALIPG